MKGVLAAAIAWRRSLDVAPAALDGPARELAQAVDAHYHAASESIPDWSKTKFGDALYLRGIRVDPSPGQQATDYGFAAERDRQLVASRAEAKREVERLRAELTREREKSASLWADAQKRAMQRAEQLESYNPNAYEVLEAERDSLRTKVTELTAEIDNSRRDWLASDSKLIDACHEAQRERDALVVTVKLLSRSP